MMTSEGVGGNLGYGLLLTFRVIVPNGKADILYVPAGVLEVSGSQESSRDCACRGCIRKEANRKSRVADLSHLIRVRVLACLDWVT